VGEITHSYGLSAQRSDSLDSLVQCTKAMIQQVVTLTMPKIRVDYIPLDREMPQDDLINEERKDEMTYD
jgi:hypothetical protein